VSTTVMVNIVTVRVHYTVVGFHLRGIIGLGCANNIVLARMGVAPVRMEEA